jgi:rSAM/selenodomain-associated transferase 1
MTESVAIAVLAKAPLSGFAKTRLIPRLGATGAALLQARLIERAAATACTAAVGPVTLWAAPDANHPCFLAAQARGIALACQGSGDLGARMLAAFAAANGPALVIGTDCPSLTPEHLRTAADVLRSGSDVVLGPAEDGGYGLIGMRVPQPALFENMPWGTANVLTETRRRLKERGFRWQEPVTLWDVDRPEDLDRLRETGLGELLDSTRNQ